MSNSSCVGRSLSLFCQSLKRDSEVMRFFETINFTNVNLKGAKREAFPLFDYSSFREAWTNACLHNDWNNAIPPSINGMEYGSQSRL